MNHYAYDDIPIGFSITFTVVITEEMASHFTGITGDVNPLHTDKSYARNAGYSDKVAYGMLTASFLSTLAGMYLPGENSLIHKVEVEFPAPVFIGDRLVFSGKVVKKDDRFRIIELAITATNSDKQKVLRGKMRVEVRQ